MTSIAPLLSCKRCHILVLVLLVAASLPQLASTVPSTAPISPPAPPPLSASDLQGLQAILRHWPALATLPSLPWTNLASTCNNGAVGNIYGVKCSTSGGYSVIAQLVVDNTFGAENATDSLVNLGSFLPHMVDLTLQNTVLLSATQSALITPNVSSLYMLNATGTPVLNFSTLAALQFVSIEGIADVTTIAPFSNSITLLYLTIVGNPLLSQLQGPFPAKLSVLYVISCPLLTTLPSLAPVTSLVEMFLIDLPITTFPTLPATHTLQGLWLESLPNLTSIPSFVAYPISQLTLNYNPQLAPYISQFKTPAISALDLTGMQLTDSTLNLTWFCNLTTSSVSRVVLDGNDLSAVPACMANFRYMYMLSLVGAGDNITTLPSWIFNSSVMQQLYISSLPSLNYTTLQGITWNLTLGADYSLPGEFAKYNIPSAGTACTSNVVCQLAFASPVNGPIPDGYFNIWKNASSIYAGSANITGTIPSSLQNLTLLTSLDFSHNALNGTLPLALFELPQLTYFDFSDNQLTGILPNLSTIYPSVIANSYIPYLNLSTNDFDLCNSQSFTVPNFSTPNWCIVGGDCTSCSATISFAECSIDSCFVLPPPVAPISPPVAPPVSLPVSPPVSVPAPAVPLCVGYPAPSVGSWVCSSTGWISNVSIVTTQPITVPSTVVVVEGNFSAPQIVFSGLNSSVVSQGCINVTSLQVNLNQQDLTQLSSMSRNRTVLQQNSSLNCAPLSAVPLSVIAPSGCQQVTGTTSASDPSTLQALFVVDSTACGGKGFELWWIILAAVLGGVVLIVALIAFIVVVRRKRMVTQQRYRIDSAALRPSK